MTFFSFLPPWLNPKLVLYWFLGLSFMGLLWSWNERGHKIDRLSNFQTEVISAISTATVPPDSKGNIRPLKSEQVVTAINALDASSRSAKTTLSAITAESLKAKDRANKSDKALKMELSALNQRFASANRKIQSLENRPPVKPSIICPTIIEDTNSAWDGWK